MSTEEAALDTSEAKELYRGLREARLRRRCQWGGLVLGLSFLAPYEVILGVPQFLWQTLGELPPAAILAAFSLSVAGFAIFAGSRWAERSSSLALLVLASLASVLLVSAWGAEAAAWDAVPLPAGFAERPGVLLLPYALAGAGADLAFRSESRLAGRRLLALSAVATLPVYLWPDHGVLPARALVELLVSIPELDSYRFVLGYGLIAALGLLTLFVGLVGVLLAVRPPREEPKLLAPVLTFALPGFLCFFVARSVLLTLAGGSIVSEVVGVVILAAAVGVVSAAIECGVAAFLERKSRSDALPSRAFAGGTVGAVILVGGAQLALSRPPEKGVEWTLKASSPAGDELFGTLLPDWNRSRGRWDQGVREKSSAAQLVEVQRAGRVLLRQSQSVDGELEAPLGLLMQEAKDLDLAGRRWYRLVHHLNETSRQRGLPYYVDPTVLMAQTEHGIVRLFNLDAYRIEHVTRVTVDGEPFSALRVRSLGKKRTSHNLLGFSRDLQPFALVAMDEIEPFAKELAELTEESPPRCFEDAPTGDPALDECGMTLARLLAKKGSFLPLLIAMTERHELQHQADGPLLPIATAVRERMHSYSEEAQVTVNRELSAYVAELTSTDGEPALGLAHLFGFAWSGGRSELAHVSTVAFEALSERSLMKDDELDRDGLRKAYLELSKLGADELRARATDAWQRLYGRTLERVERM